MFGTDPQQKERASSLPPQHPNTVKTKKITPSTSPTMPVERMMRRNSTPGKEMAQHNMKAYSQVKSQKMELKFGMSPLKTQQFSAQLIESQKKTEKRKMESSKTKLDELSFGRWSFRLPKMKSQSYPMKGRNDFNNYPPTTKNMSATHKVTDWLNEEQRTPPPPPRRKSVSDMREISRIPAITLPVVERTVKNISTNSINKTYQEIKPEPVKQEKAVPIVKTRKEKPQVGDTNPAAAQPTENRPNTLLRRSVSDLKQKSISARQFLKLLDKKEYSYSLCPKENLEDLSDKQSNEVVDISDDKEIMNICDVVDQGTKEEEKSMKFGSILKRPGNKRANIKHVEFLEDNENENGIRYF